MVRTSAFGDAYNRTLQINSVLSHLKTQEITFRVADQSSPKNTSYVLANTNTCSDPITRLF